MKEIRATSSVFWSAYLASSASNSLSSGASNSSEFWPDFSFSLILANSTLKSAVGPDSAWVAAGAAGAGACASERVSGMKVTTAAQAAVRICFFMLKGDELKMDGT